eukprot:TRINITY_DN16346_c0_g1_i1.p1 TRINITY_DN16346_c0_g1~~TRINITY_DN16346_c0_g1_i1.p1  ORF type:complete len:375 (+),score=54.22 TRINITY_DN16346_c0_g1_i1:113-1126(+)
MIDNGITEPISADVEKGGDGDYLLRVRETSSYYLSVASIDSTNFKPITILATSITSPWDANNTNNDDTIMDIKHMDEVCSSAATERTISVPARTSLPTHQYLDLGIATLSFRQDSLVHDLHSNDGAGLDGGSYDYCGTSPHHSFTYRAANNNDSDSQADGVPSPVAGGVSFQHEVVWDDRKAEYVCQLAFHNTSPYIVAVDRLSYKLVGHPEQIVKMVNQVLSPKVSSVIIHKRVIGLPRKPTLTLEDVEWHYHIVPSAIHTLYSGTMTLSFPRVPVLALATRFFKSNPSTSKKEPDFSFHIRARQPKSLYIELENFSSCSVIVPVLYLSTSDTISL